MNKTCTQKDKHDTCKHKMWTGGGEKLCQLTSPGCNYRSKNISFSHVPNDAVMFCGDIEKAGEFHTKAEWFTEYGENAFEDYAMENHGDSNHPWYTATLAIAEIYLPTLLDNIAEDEEMYDGWYENVLIASEDDPAVKDGINRLNEIFASHPTYYEDQRVLFEPKGTPCIYFKGIDLCTCNNPPDDPGECIYTSGIETVKSAFKCKYYKGK